MSYRTKHMKHQLSPLTEENLLKMNDDRVTSTYDAIQRYYCSSGNEAPTHHQLRIQTQTRPASTPPPANLQQQQQHQPRLRRESRDIVMESPRLSPFPYHNDCHFLPTAEHKQHQQQKKKKHMTTGSFSDLSLRSQRTCHTNASCTTAHTMPFAYSARRATNASSPPPPSPSSFANAIRRSSSSTSTPSSRRRWYPQEPSLSSSSTSSSSTSGTSSSFYKMGSSFLARLLDLMKKNKTHNNKATMSPPPPQEQEEEEEEEQQQQAPRLPKKNLVWFAEFAVNPPPPNGMMVTAA